MASAAADAMQEKEGVDPNEPFARPMLVRQRGTYHDVRDSRPPLWKLMTEARSQPLVMSEAMYEAYLQEGYFQASRMREISQREQEAQAYASLMLQGDRSKRRTDSPPRDPRGPRPRPSER